MAYADWMACAKRYEMSKVPHSAVCRVATRSYIPTPYALRPTPYALRPTPYAQSPTTMHDPRIDQLAELLLDHSCQIQTGEKILIEAFDLPDVQLISQLVNGAAARGAVPLVTLKKQRSAQGALSIGDGRIDAAGVDL